MAEKKDKTPKPVKKVASTEDTVTVDDSTQQQDVPLQQDVTSEETPVAAQTQAVQASAAPSADSNEIIQKIVQGYTFTGPAINVGVAMADDQVYPDAKVNLPLKMMNRHGLIAGATGTGKTVTLQTIAEQLSQQGVPTLLSDVKGDLTGMATPGVEDENIQKRVQETGQEWQAQACPTEIFSLGGQGGGVPIRATLTAFGPLLLARIMELNDTQESCLQIIFHYADQKQLDLIDLKDLNAVIQYLQSDKGKPDLKALGGIDSRTLGVIVRKITTLQANGLDNFFGEPEFDTQDLLRTTQDGQGIVNLLELKDVVQNPLLFSTFLIWLVTDLFAELPEVGDQDKPKLVFFIDEAHLIFKDASSAFLTAITQTVRLIRSKGVGIFFCTQTPKDVDKDVLAQLANRVQHALRSYTPDDAKTLKATVSTFPYSDYDLNELLTTLGTGEAVVTVMDETGAPTPVAWTKVRTPESKIGPSDASVIQQIESSSQLLPHYQDTVDNASAFENLNPQAQPAAQAVANGSVPQVPVQVPPVPMNGMQAAAAAPAQTIPAEDAQPAPVDPNQALDAEAQRIQDAVLNGNGDVTGQMPPLDLTQHPQYATPNVNQQAQANPNAPIGAAAQLQQQDSGIGDMVAGIAGAVAGSQFLKSASSGFARQFGTNLARSLFGTAKRSRRK